MQLKCGNFTHAIGEVGYSIARDLVLDAAKRPILATETWDLTGRVYNTTGNTRDMDTVIGRLEAAYADPGDLILLHDDGSPTTNRMKRSECLEGPRLVRPLSYPNAKGPYYALWVDFAVTVQCSRAVTSAPTFMSFEETLSFEGGGPQRGLIETLRGRPQLQLLRRNTIYRATQRGSAVGFYGAPSAPEPLFPDALMRPDFAQPVSYGPRQRIGDFSFGYQVSWEYQFESASPLSGLPNYY